MIRKLGDIATYVNGYAFKPSDWSDEGIPIIRIQDLTGNSYQLHRYNGIYDKKYEIIKGDILISWSASLGVYVWQGEKAVLNQHIFKVIFNKEYVNKDFFVYQMEAILAQSKSKTHGATMVHLTKPIFNALPFNLPNRKEQEQIASQLNIISLLIETRKKQIRKLDQLIKSRFIELFGDPILNQREWEVCSVIEKCGCMVPERDKPKSFTGSTPWITIEDLNVNGVTFKSKSGLGLTNEEIKEVKRKTIPVGSVIMSCVGNLGICSIAGCEMVINQQLHAFQCGEEMNNIFLMHYLSSRKDYMEKNASSTTVLYMNKRVCNTIPIIVPPIELQNKFADFVKQSGKSKFKVQKNLDELELLKKSLMQKYFK